MARSPTTSDAFNAVAEPRRRQILDLLARGERPVNDIVAALGLAQPQVSKHLRVLSEVGLVSVRGSGQQRLYKLNADRLKPIHDWVKSFEQFWTESLDRLDDYLKELRRGRRSMAVRSEPAVSSDREIVVTRVLDAPRELVFAGVDRPEARHALVGAAGVHDHDARDGRAAGRRLAVRHARPGRHRLPEQDRLPRGRAARPPGLPARRGEGTEDVKFHTTVTFAKEGGKTRLTLRMVFETAEERNTVVEKYGAVEGGKQTLERLGEYVATRRWRTARSSPRGSSTRRGNWCSGRSSDPDAWRAGGGRRASRTRSTSSTCGRAAAGASPCTARTAPITRRERLRRGGGSRAGRLDQHRGDRSTEFRMTITFAEQDGRTNSPGRCSSTRAEEFAG